MEGKILIFLFIFFVKFYFIFFTFQTVTSTFSGNNSKRDIKYEFDNESVASSRFSKITAPLSIKQEKTGLAGSSRSGEKQLVENPFARKKETRTDRWIAPVNKVEATDPEYQWRAPPSSKYDDCETDSNPWSVRNSQSLRAPLDSSMHFPSLSEGHRRPITHQAMSSTSSNWSAGRGKLTMQREPSPPGTSSFFMKRELSESPPPPGTSGVTIKRELSSSPSLSPSPPGSSTYSSIGRGMLIKREPSPIDYYLERGKLNIRK